MVEYKCPSCGVWWRTEKQVINCYKRDIAYETDIIKKYDIEFDSETFVKPNISGQYVYTCPICKKKETLFPTAKLEAFKQIHYKHTLRHIREAIQNKFKRLLSTIIIKSRLNKQDKVVKLIDAVNNSRKQYKGINIIKRTPDGIYYVENTNNYPTVKLEDMKYKEPNNTTEYKIRSWFQNES